MRTSPPVAAAIGKSLLSAFAHRQPRSQPVQRDNNQLVLLETPSLPRTIGEMLRQSSGKGRSLKDHLSGLITQRREEASSTGSPLSDECTDALQRLL